MRKAIVQALSLGVSCIIFLSVIFISAGTLNYWQGWLYSLVVAISLTVFNISIATHEPEAMARRMKIGAPYEKQLRQKIITSLVVPVFLGYFILVVLDYRFHWSYVPWFITVLGNGLVLALSHFPPRI